MKRGRLLLRFFLLLVFVLSVRGAIGQEKISVGSADALMKSGEAGRAAEAYYRAFLAKPSAELLIKTGRALDRAKLKFYEDADRRCYLGKRREEARPECFEAYVANLNSLF